MRAECGLLVSRRVGTWDADDVKTGSFHGRWEFPDMASSSVYCRRLRRTLSAEQPARVDHCQEGLAPRLGTAVDPTTEYQLTRTPAGTPTWSARPWTTRPKRS